MTIGRPRRFDVDKALHCAMVLFWRKGYEGTSLTDLTKAMAISRPSLYGTFGNKQALFRKALEHYERKYMSFFRVAMRKPTACAVVAFMLQSYIDSMTASCNPGGCLGINAALACSEAAAGVQLAVIARRKLCERTLAGRLRRARKDGDLPADIDPVDLASYLMTLAQGMAVQAASGADRGSLYRVAAISQRAWSDEDPAGDTSSGTIEHVSAKCRRRLGSVSTKSAPGRFELRQADGKSCKRSRDADGHRPVEISSSESRIDID